MTSYAMPTFAAFMSQSKVEIVKNDRAVAAVEQSFRSEDFSTWANRMDGAELVPWGKAATGTDDSSTSSQVVYEIDGDVNAHPDLPNVTQGEVNVLISQYPGHGMHVAGILAGLSNNGGTRGVNPGGNIIAVHIGGTNNEVQTAMDWVLADAEQRGIYAVANVSSSAPRYASGGAIAPWFRRISNRVLLVQSAGNQKSDACLFAYGPKSPNDGILVVGGIDENGAQGIPYDNSGIYPYGIEDGSNWGTCVEVWAPSERIYSAWDRVIYDYVYLSGTSMAAPYVAGLAARYGSSSTTPVERENFIRAKLFWAGHYDIGWNLIYVPSFFQSPAFTIPTRLWASSVTADSTYAGSSPAYVNDGHYLSNLWNAGHYAPGWIELDLGSTKTLTSIRLSPEQFPAGSSTHYVYAGNSPAPSSLVATISGNSATLEPLVATFSASARYVRVYTASSTSWVAWREIEVYGH